MELKSFREVLLKKAQGNPYLETLIEYAGDEIIAEGVLESLRKMAEGTAALGRGANHALTTYAAGLGEPEVEQLRNALGHHISHYAGALKGYHAAKAANDPVKAEAARKAADEHANKIIPMMHLAGRAAKHSGGQLVLDYPSTTPWESNYTTTHRHAHNGKLKEGTKDLGRRPVSKKDARKTNIRAVPDYRYLEMAPHPEHAGTAKLANKGAYPFEEIQLGHPEKRDAGKAYLPIEDVGEQYKFQEHPFDQHPIHKYSDLSESEMRPEHHEAFKEAMSNWDSSPHHQKYLQDEEAKAMKDPEAYEAMGSKKPEHPFKGIPLLPRPENTNEPAPASTPAQAAPSNPQPSKQVEEDLDTVPEGVTGPIASYWKEFSPESKRDILAKLKNQGKK